MFACLLFSRACNISCCRLKLYRLQRLDLDIVRARVRRDLSVRLPNACSPGLERCMRGKSVLTCDELVAGAQIDILEEAISHHCIEDVTVHGLKCLFGIGAHHAEAANVWRGGSLAA